MKGDILPKVFPDSQKSIYAGFWVRLAAFLVDGIVTLPVLVIVFFINDADRLNAFYTLIPNYAFLLMYNVYLVKRWGATPGKMFLKIKIVRKDGAIVGWREAILRQIIQYALAIPLSLIATIPLLYMTDAEFNSNGFMGRFMLINEMLPFGFTLLQWINNGSIYVDGLFLVLTKRKRAGHDFIAGTVVIETINENAVRAWHAQHSMSLVEPNAAG